MGFMGGLEGGGSAKIWRRVLERLGWEKCGVRAGEVKGS